jgi:hypothetical protein
MLSRYLTGRGIGWAKGLELPSRLSYVAFKLQSPGMDMSKLSTGNIHQRKFDVRNYPNFRGFHKILHSWSVCYVDNQIVQMKLSVAYKWIKQQCSHLNLERY